jgi:hypothetical protein
MCPHRRQNRSIGLARNQRGQINGAVACHCSLGSLRRLALFRRRLPPTLRLGYPRIRPRYLEQRL